MTPPLLDIHTHDISRHNAVVSVSPDTPLHQGVLYSVGVHPWHADTVDIETALRALREKASHQQVVAIGEIGLDPFRGGPFDQQLDLLLRQLEISRLVDKPVILHIVRHHNTIIDLRRRLRPAQPWIIHGFRGKPQLARQLLDHGFYLSLGERYNSQSAAIIPPDRLLVESDESRLPIDEIAGAFPALDPALPYRLLRLPPDARQSAATVAQ